MLTSIGNLVRNVIYLSPSFYMVTQKSHLTFNRFLLISINFDTLYNTFPLPCEYCGAANSFRLKGKTPTRVIGV